MNQLYSFENIKAGKLQPTLWVIKILRQVDVFKKSFSYKTDINIFFLQKRDCWCCQSILESDNVSFIFAFDIQEQSTNICNNSIIDLRYLRNISRIYRKLCTFHERKTPVICFVPYGSLFIYIWATQIRLRGRQTQIGTIFCLAKN